METTLIPGGTVVVGVDGSPSCERALEWAVDHAVRERRQLTLVHAVDPARPDESDVLRPARARVRELAPDLAVHEALWPADPQVVLLQLAQRAAVVVVGSHGRGPVRRALLGSVGHAIVRQPPCPVVVVRPHHPGVVRHGVVVGVDPGERCRPVLEFAYRQASLRDLPLTILHGTGQGEDLDDGQDVGLGEAVAGMAEKFPDVRARTQVVPGPPGAALAGMSRRMDLIVVGAHHGGVLRGSVTNDVVEHAECPVAVVPLAVAGSAA